MNRNLLTAAGNAITVGLGLVLWVICIVSVTWLGIRAMSASSRRRIKSNMQRPRRLRFGRRAG